MSNKSFLIYTDLLCSLDELSDAQAGKLFKAIKAYHMSRSEGEGQDCKAEFDCLMNDFVTRLAFAPFRASFERDAEKYQTKIARLSENGKKGGRPKKDGESGCISENQEKANGFSESKRFFGKAKKAVNVNVNVNDNVNKEILSDESTKKDEAGDVAPPSPARAPTAHGNFLRWMSESAPNVYRAIGHRMTEAEYGKIRGIIGKETLVDYVLAMENRKDLVKRYRSLYLTLRNWIKRDEREK